LPAGRKTMKTVLITLPVRNEAAMLDGSFRRLVRGLDGAGVNYRLSIAEDGSSDGTPAVIRGLQAEFPKLIVSSSRVRRGRGLALRELWSEVDADIYAFVDADLAAGPPALVRVISEVERGADVATGSRYCPGATVHRPPLRQLVSRAYNRFVRMTFGESIQDHQCGLKAFSREAKTELFAMTRENSWAWDTEVIVLAALAGLRVVEVPVDWTEYRGVRTPLRRLMSDVYLHGSALIRLKVGLRERMKAQSRPSTTFSATSADVGSTQDKGSAFLR
jgi:glycosyltransferase involved in cell wall biosynthesis